MGNLMRQALIATLVFFLLAAHAAAQGYPANEESLKVAAPPHLLSSEEYVNHLVKTAKGAIRMLIATHDPIFGDEAGVALQTLATQRVAATVLFPTKSSFAEYLPSLRTGHNLCRTVHRNTPASMQPIIICDPEEIRQLDILMRVGHSPLLLTYTANDWKLMDLLERIQRDPEGLLKESQPQLIEGHAEDHLTFLLVFLLAHESWHLAHQASASFAPSPMIAGVQDDDLLTKTACRNYEEFLRQGIKLDFGDDPAKSRDDEPNLENKHQQKAFESSRAVWKDELAADMNAASTLVRLVHFSRQTAHLKQPDVEQVASEMVQTFGYIIMVSWYSQQIAFAHQNCQTYANQDFFLSRCLCSDIKLYSQIRPWFSSSHPPMILRMYVAAMQFLVQIKNEGDVDATTTKNPQLLVAVKWLMMMHALLDVPLKLSVAECTLVPLLGATGGSSIAQILPDFAGFGSKGSTKYFGYPADEPAFLKSCKKDETRSSESKQRDSPDLNHSPDGPPVVTPNAPPVSQGQLSFGCAKLDNDTGERLPRFEEYSDEAFEGILSRIPRVHMVDRTRVETALLQQQATGSFGKDLMAAGKLASAVGARFLFTGTAKKYTAGAGEESLTMELVVVDAVTNSYVFRHTYTTRRPQGAKRGHRELLDAILAAAQPDLMQLVADL
jgi:hypothetical protein